MAKIFIDGGTNLCQGLNEIMNRHNMDESWTIYSFEVNPNTFAVVDHSRFPNVVFINKGLWSENCERSLTIEKLPFLDGHHVNFLKDKNSVHDLLVGGSSNVIDESDWISPIGSDLVLKSTKKVECVDLSEFIRNNVNPDDTLILKLDVEGAEYTILEKMIQEGTIDLVDEMYVEWHQRLLIGDKGQSEIEQNILGRGVKIHPWY